MFKNYFTIAINNLFKNKLYSAINIVGLAIGLAACIVMALYVQDESSFDKHWENSKRLYRMNYAFDIPGMSRLKVATTPFPARAALNQFFSTEIELSTRIVTSNRVVTIGNAQFEDEIISVDRPFIDMFELEELAGSLETTLSTPSNIGLSEELARRYFGTQNPIGKILSINAHGGSQRDYQVSAVYRIPDNTVLNIPTLSLIDETNLFPGAELWTTTNGATYIQLKPGFDIESLQSRLPNFILQYVHVEFLPPELDVTDIMSAEFQNMELLHLGSSWDAYRAGGDPTVVLVFSIISTLVLLIGSINFTILTTAKATQRAREVAMRKVLGAKRRQLIVQFLGESFFIVLLSMTLSLALVELILPVFESMVGKELSVNYADPSIFLSLLALLSVVGICGGVYPAFILSGFRPGNTLKANRSMETRGSLVLRNILVVFQFSVSIALIIATCVIFTQLQFSSNRDPGFNKDNLLVINHLNTNQTQIQRIASFKQALLSLANVSSVGISEVQPSVQQQSLNTYTRQGQDDASTIATTGVGYDYFQTYQIPLVAGRYYDRERENYLPEANDTATSVIDINENDINEQNLIINESAVRMLGFASAQEAIGERLTAFTNYTIIGIVADNHLFSINAPPRAEVYLLRVARPSVATVRFQGSPLAIMDQVSTVWNDVMGGVEISMVFVDQLLAEEFEQEHTEALMLISFSLLAIIIACLGLFGMASFTVNRRVKEIGLRKVMGAKVKDIVKLLVWQFLKPVLIASIIAWPVAIYAMQVWLERFPYRFDSLLMIPICLISSLIALAIAWFTVASNTTRVAKSNPIHSLRYE